MKKLILGICLILVLNPLSGQSSALLHLNSVLLYVPSLESPTEVDAHAPTLEAYLQKHLIYPDLAIEYSIEGEVKLSLLLQSNGEIAKLKVLESPGYGCEEEAIRLVHKIENWQTLFPQQYSKLQEIEISIQFRLQ